MASISGLVKGAKDLTSSGFNWGGWASTLGQIGQQLGGADYQYQLGQKAAGQEWDRNLEMWNIQNAYNSPTAQMARLEQAGLNPNLAITGGTSSGNATTLPKYQQSTGSISSKLPNVLGMLGAFQDVRIKSAKARQEEIIAQAFASDPEGIKQGVVSKYYGQNIDTKDKALTYDLREMLANTGKDGTPLDIQKRHLRDSLLYTLYTGQKEATLSSTQAQASSAWLNNSMRELDAKHYKWTKWVDLAGNNIGNILKLIFLKGKK